VSAFSVTGIEVNAAIDPANPLAFPTELTFIGTGRFTGTKTPITISVPEPGTLALVLALCWVSSTPTQFLGLGKSRWSYSARPD